MCSVFLQLFVLKFSVFLHYPQVYIISRTGAPTRTRVPARIEKACKDTAFFSNKQIFLLIFAKKVDFVGDLGKNYYLGAQDLGHIGALGG